MIFYNVCILLFGIITGYKWRCSFKHSCGRCIEPDHCDVPWHDDYAFASVLTCSSFFLVALLQAHTLASVSTMCDLLFNSINDLRLQWESADTANDVHRRVYPLMDTMRNLNNGQGLGFTVANAVIDKRTINIILLSVISFFSTTIPLLATLFSAPASASALVATPGGCNVTANKIEHMRLLFEDSCMPNVTIAELLSD